MDGMKRLPMLAALWCLGLLVGTAQARSKEQPNWDHEISALPDWVETLELKAVEGEAEEAYRYRLVDRQVNLLGEKPLQFFRYRTRYEQYSAIESGSDVRIEFAPDYQKPLIHQVDIIRNGKRINQLSADKLKFVTSEDDQQNNIYGGRVEALLLLEDVRLGDELEYSYTIEGANPVFDNQFSSFYSLGWTAEVDNVLVRVLAPKQRALKHKLVGLEQPLEVNRKSNHIEYRLRMDAVSAYVHEGDEPGWFNAYPWLQFSEYDDWREVADWAWQLFQIEDKPSAELQAFSDGLKGKKPEQIVAEATRFVQDDIRYLGLEIGENSHRPHAPNEVFANRYGDCKDKSLLLSSILNDHGIAAWPALVSTYERGHLDQYLPTPGLFNHAVVKLTLGPDDYWLDPTVSYQGSRLDTIHQPTYGQTLLIKKGTDALTEAKPSERELSKIDVQEEILAADFFSPVIWKITTRYSGAEAERQRYQLSHKSKQTLQRQFLNYYAKTYPKIRALADLEIDDNREANVLTIREKYLAPDYWQDDGKVAGFELGTPEVSNYIALPKTIVRQHPLALHRIDSVRQQVVLSMPTDVDFSDDVEKQVFENDYFKMVNRFDYDRRRLIWTNHYTRKAEEVPAEAVAEHITLLKKARGTTIYRNSITNVHNDVGVSEVKTLLQSLNRAVLKQL